MTGRAVEATTTPTVKNIFLAGSGLGSGLGVTYFVAEMLKADPKLAIQTVTQWGPLFVLFAITLYLCDRRFGQLIDKQGETANQMVAAHVQGAAAQQAMADAVNRIASKDSDREREMELVLGHLTRNSERTRDLLLSQSGLLQSIAERLDKIEEQRELRADGHHAG
ncbi:MAG: hypothetical protein JWN45_2939 [Acidobacteriaceae bacterium]|nr:hypothetical protein [Acidobacteriaceae bacterium]